MNPSAIWTFLRDKSIFFPLLTLTLATMGLVSPVGDFPLIDDFLHARLVEQLHANPHYEGHPYLASTFFAQALWGWLFTSLFGFSDTVLRFSTLVLAPIAAWAVARCALHYGLSRAGALVCGLLVLANPIYLTLSYTFMTDIPFFTAVAVSALFYMRGLQDGRARDIALGTVLSIVALFVRQHGVFMLVAFAATLLVKRAIFREHPSRGIVLSFCIPALIGVALFAAWQSTHGLNPVQAGWLDTMWRTRLENIGHMCRFPFVALVYLGLFIVPITCARAVQLLISVERWTLMRWCCFGSIAVATGTVLVTAPGMTRLPLLNNILYDLGTGPYLLTDVWRMAGRDTLVSIGKWWWPITGIAILSSSVLVTDVLFRSYPRRHSTETDSEAPASPPVSDLGVFLFCWGVLYVVGHLPFVPRIFDRYLLVAMAPAVIFCARFVQWSTRARAVLFVGVPLLGVYLFSLVGVQDYMSWNRARWTAINKLLNEMQVEPERIDGGYEYNGRYTMETYIKRHNHPRYDEYGMPGWWVIDDTYRIASKPLDGYIMVDQVPYFSWLGMQQRHVLVLKRQIPKSI